jgi:oligopeptidase A
MEYCSDENVRKDFSVARNQFATESENDNRPIVLQILKLKDKKAKLMGYKNFAEVSLAKKMAKSPEIVFELLE